MEVSRYKYRSQFYDVGSSRSSRSFSYHPVTHHCPITGHPKPVSYLTR